MTLDPEASSPLAESQRDTTSDAGVKATVSSQLPTLGERLAREARRLASSHMPAYPWLRLLDPAMKRVNSLPVPSETRFQRTEAARVVAPFRAVTHEPLAEAGLSWPGQLFPYPDAKEQFVEGEVGGWTQPFSHPTVEEPLSGGSNQMWGQPLSPYTQQRLRDFVGPGAEAIRVHTDEAANAITNAQQAHAVTVGEHVFFRQGRFRPHEDEGFALLTHEAMHVVQAMRPGAAWRRATQVGVQEEEREAGVQERRALAARRDSTFLRHPPSSVQDAAAPGRYPSPPERPRIAPGPGVASSPLHRPMTAPAERTMDNATPPSPSMPDVEDLKRTLYRDLMRQIRADLERGG